MNIALEDTPEGSCPLPNDDPRYLAYHDTEWGMPATDDRSFFEKVCLETFQAGLSWSTILYRRDALRAAFSDFDIDRVADFTATDVARILENPLVIRNRRKIESCVNNAQRAVQLRDEAGSLTAFFWSHEPPPDERPDRVTWRWVQDNPHSPASHKLAEALKSRGWKFVGPTGMYALMQALGLVNDHIETCPARARVERARNDWVRPHTAMDSSKPCP